MIETSAEKLAQVSSTEQFPELLTELVRAAYEARIFSPPFGASQFIRRLEEEATNLLRKIPLTCRIIEESDVSARAKNVLLQCLRSGAETVADVTDDLVKKQYNAGAVTLEQIASWRRAFLGR